MPRAVMLGTGAFVPDREVTNDAMRARFDPQVIDKLEAATGITTRFASPEGWATSDLAVAAARNALDMAGTDARDLDLIVVGTDSPDYVTPATSVLVQHKLGAARAGSFDVGCACASFPTAIAAASAMIAGQRSIRRVLVVGAYMMRKLAHPSDPMAFFYGDGAGAVVLGPSNVAGYLGAAFRADGSYARRWGVFAGGTVEPASEVAVREGRTCVRLVERYPESVNEEGWPSLVRQLADENAFRIEEIDHAIFTQVRKSTIDRVMAELDLPRDRAPTMMDRVGYTGSACVPIALDSLVRGGRVKPGDLVVMVGSGVGYNQAAVAVRATRDLTPFPKPASRTASSV